MEKLKSTLPNILLSLTVICLVAGIALSAANKYTADAIARSKAAELQNAIKNVTPGFDNNPMEEQYKAAVTEGDSLIIYPAKKEGQPVGCAVESYTKKGFSGIIRVMVGFDTEGKLLNYSVLEHNETPGLGSKMEEWFRQDKNRRNIIGRNLKKGGLKVANDGGDVDAITAATISSRAFLDAINLAYSAYSGNTDATSGATGSVDADATSSATGTDTENKATENHSTK
ncbi:MAG: RnfABCDGE type electron transport complex subunit G [Tannerella sp.]|jgi:electron transport complex protein RnfG|nr:RnfABCDGE type electron transport complex subunit G [Tannerella sp.]